MTNPPPITREARDWLLAQISGQFHFCRDEVAEIVKRMSLAPADPLNAVRARFRSKTLGRHEYHILAAAGGFLFGIINIAGDAPAVWDSDGEPRGYPHHWRLIPVSPHAALIAELREQADNHDWFHQMRGLFKRAADALEAIEVQK